jgi:hypothetical protein
MSFSRIYKKKIEHPENIKIKSVEKHKIIFNKTNVFDKHVIELYKRQ